MPHVGMVVVELDRSLGNGAMQELVKGLWSKNRQVWLLEADDFVEWREPISAHGQPSAVANDRSKTLPNDTYFNRQWALNNPKNTAADIRAMEAWELVETVPASETEDVIVALIDSGVDLTHPEFDNNIFVNLGEIPGNGIDDDENGYIDDVNGWNFSANTNDIFDYSTHGSHTAGIIAAERDNSYAMSGIVTKKVKLLPLAFRNLATEAIEAIEYSLDIGAQVSSNSWGFNRPIESLRVAIDKANSAGQLFVCAVDNRGRDNASFEDYPPNWGVDKNSSSGLPNILRVANSDSNGRVSASSNYGSDTVDLTAPGEDIVSTIPLSEGATLAYKSGTSMATPHVAAVAGVLLSLDPTLRPAELREMIMASVTQTNNLTRKVISGGSLNFRKAVESVLTRLQKSGKAESPTTIAPTSTESPVDTLTNPPPPTEIEDSDDTTVTSEAPSASETEDPSTPFGLNIGNTNVGNNFLNWSNYQTWLSEFEYSPGFFTWPQNRSTNDEVYDKKKSDNSATNEK